MKCVGGYIALFLATAPTLVFGQSKGAIKQAIEAKFILAQPTADHKDISAAGSVPAGGILPQVDREALSHGFTNVGTPRQNEI